MDFKRNFVLVCSVLFFSAGCWGQTVTASYNPDTQADEVLVTFTITDLPTQNDNWDKFNGTAYFRAFVIYGDGNYERIGTKESPIRENTSFTHSYRKINNNYSVQLLLESRKDEDEPEDPEEMPTGTNQSGIITSKLNINLTDTPTSGQKIFSISRDETEDHIPEIPMIKAPNKKIKLGLSHHHFKDSVEQFYFLQGSAFHAMPIAYKPNSEGLILLFYKSEVDNIEFDNSMTNVPNYDETEISPVDLDNRASNSFLEFPIPLSSNPFGSTTPAINLTGTGYDRMLKYEITQDEANLLNEVVSGVRGSTPNSGELRITPFFKTIDDGIEDFNLLDINEVPEANFLAVLYEIKERINQKDFIFLRTSILNNNSPDIPVDSLATLPETIFTNDKLYYLKDYFLLKAKKGEPDDPGGLIITNIEKDGDEYIVDFQLAFMNSEDAEVEAAKVKIFLSHIDNQQIVSDINLIEECLSSYDYPNLYYCQIDYPNVNYSSTDSNYCEGGSTMLNYQLSDGKFCYNLMQPGNDGLKPGETAILKFSGRIHKSNIDRLIHSSVLQYCVKLLGAGTIDVGEFCRPNIILKDSTCYRIPADSTFVPVSPAHIICKVNPIWEDVEENCTNLTGIWKKHPWHCCLIGLVLLFLLFCCFLKPFRKH